MPMPRSKHATPRFWVNVPIFYYIKILKLLTFKCSSFQRLNSPPVFSYFRHKLLERNVICYIYKKKNKNKCYFPSRRLSLWIKERFWLDNVHRAMQIWTWRLYLLIYYNMIFYNSLFQHFLKFIIVFVHLILPPNNIP